MRRARGGKPLNDFAWFLVICADREVRNPAEAVVLATRAVTREPEVGNF